MSEDENNDTNADFTTESAIKINEAITVEGPDRQRIAKVPDKNGNQRTLPFPIFSETAYEDLDVWKIPIDLVYFNFDNLRIGKYKKNKCITENIDRLDPANDDHQEFVAEILRSAKDYGQKKVANLEKELLKAGQLDPALITVDGTLWNGNRRCAIMRKLFSDPPPTGLGNLVDGFIYVCVLPPMRPEQLRALEKRLQQEPETKADYGEVNEMVHIQEVLNDFSEEHDLQNANEDQKNELLTDISSPTFKSWEACLKAKNVVDLMDQYLESRNQHDPRELRGFYQLFEELSGVPTWWLDVETLLNEKIHPFFTKHSRIGEEDYDADEMVEAWKQKLFLSLDSLLENNNESEVYKPIRALGKVFDRASGDVNSRQPGDTTAYLVSLLENSYVIKNWNDLLDKEPEEFVTIGQETEDVGGVATPIKQKEKDEISDTRDFVQKLDKDPAWRLEKVKEDLEGITDNLDRVGPNNPQITQYIDDCRQSLTEIEDQNNAEPEEAEDQNNAEPEEAGNSNNSN